MSYLHSRVQALPMEAPVISMHVPLTAPALAAAGSIMREYTDSLAVDLSFQDVEAELATLPGDYAEPRGLLLLALAETLDGAAPGPDEGLPLPSGQCVWVAGCCALRPLDTTDYANAAEMKRLYVRSAFRGLGLGRQLAETVLETARAAGYGCVLLDTLDTMESARTLYLDLGFAEVPPYYHNPIPGAHYLKADL